MVKQAIMPNSSAGTYVMILSLRTSRFIQVGKLGAFNFRAGYYGYVGSALGPGGLIARLKHHVKKKDTPHWHIDYLTTRSALKEIWFSHLDVRREHFWATVMEKMPGASIPVRGFGSTDCRCTAHLFYFLKSPRIRVFQKGFGKDGFTGCVEKFFEFSPLLLHEGIDKRFLLG